MATGPASVTVRPWVSSVAFAPAPNACVSSTSTRVVSVPSWSATGPAPSACGLATSTSPASIVIPPLPAPPHARLSAPRTSLPAPDFVSAPPADRAVERERRVRGRVDRAMAAEVQLALAREGASRRIGRAATEREDAGWPAERRVAGSHERAATHRGTAGVCVGTAESQRAADHVQSARLPEICPGSSPCAAENEIVWEPSSIAPLPVIELNVAAPFTAEMSSGAVVGHRRSRWRCCRSPQARAWRRPPTSVAPVYVLAPLNVCGPPEIVTPPAPSIAPAKGTARVGELERARTQQHAAAAGQCFQCHGRGSRGHVERSCHVHTAGRGDAPRGGERERSAARNSGRTGVRVRAAQCLYPCRHHYAARARGRAGECAGGLRERQRVIAEHQGTVAGKGRERGTSGGRRDVESAVVRDAARGGNARAGR